MREAWVAVLVTALALALYFAPPRIGKDAHMSEELAPDELRLSEIATMLGVLSQRADPAAYGIAVAARDAMRAAKADQVEAASLAVAGAFSLAIDTGARCNRNARVTELDLLAAFAEYGVQLAPPDPEVPAPIAGSGGASRSRKPRQRTRG